MCRTAPRGEQAEARDVGAGSIPETVSEEAPFTGTMTAGLASDGAIDAEPA